MCKSFISIYFVCEEKCLFQLNIIRQWEVFVRASVNRLGDFICNSLILVGMFPTCMINKMNHTIEIASQLEVGSLGYATGY